MWSVLSFDRSPATLTVLFAPDGRRVAYIVGANGAHRAARHRRCEHG